jgi:hypothetical protein
MAIPQPEHAEIVEWMGEDFDPTAFELAAINADLKRLKQPQFVLLPAAPRDRVAMSPIPQ